MKKSTIKDLAVVLGAEYPDAAALMRIMLSQGLAKAVGKVPAAGGKGKPSIVYEYPDRVRINLKGDSQAIATAETVPNGPVTLEPTTQPDTVLAPLVPTAPEVTEPLPTVEVQPSVEPAVTEPLPTVEVQPEPQPEVVQPTVEVQPEPQPEAQKAA